MEVLYSNSSKPNFSRILNNAMKQSRVDDLNLNSNSSTNINSLYATTSSSSTSATLLYLNEKANLDLDVTKKNNSNVPPTISRFPKLPNKSIKHSNSKKKLNEFVTNEIIRKTDIQTNMVDSGNSSVIVNFLM
jgi:hypothetical protein